MGVSHSHETDDRSGLCRYSHWIQRCYLKKPYVMKDYIILGSKSVSLSKREYMVLIYL